MKHDRRRTAAAVAMIAALAMLSGVGGQSALAQSAHGQGHGSHESTGASQAYMDAMSKMDADMQTMKMTGKAGVDFAAMMIPHHQSAIDMARAYLDSGENDPELTKLSREIIAAQESEIAFLRDWLKRNGE